MTTEAKQVAHTPKRETIHFGSFDGRFCGTRKQLRRYTLDPNEVTCPRCKAKDAFALSPQADAYVQELERAAHSKAGAA